MASQQLFLFDLGPKNPFCVTTGVWMIPGLLTESEQANVLGLIEEDSDRRLVAPSLPNGTQMNHSFFCYGYDWRPYQYSASKKRMPFKIKDLTRRALSRLSAVTEEVERYGGQDHIPDTAIVNRYSVGSSLAMHVDKSEDEVLRKAGSPIVTVSLGLSAVFRLETRGGNIDLECRSGDALVMMGLGRNLRHGVTKVLPCTSLLSDSRWSITLRRAVRGEA